MTKDPQLEFIESNLRIVEDVFRQNKPGAYHDIQLSRERPSLGRFAWRHLLGLIFKLDRNVDRVVGNLERRLAEVENDAEEDRYDSIQDVDEVKAQLNELKGRFEIALRQLNTNTLDVVRVKEKNDTADALAKRLAVIEKQLGINQGTVKQVSFSELSSILNPIVRIDISEPDEDELDDSDDEDQRGLPGHPRPEVNEAVPGSVARQDMLNHPDTVYERVGYPGLKYRFHEGRFEMKGGFIGETFKVPQGFTDFDCRDGHPPAALTTPAWRYRKVDTSVPLTSRAAPPAVRPLIGTQVSADVAERDMLANPGTIYDSEGCLRLCFDGKQMLKSGGGGWTPSVWGNKVSPVCQWRRSGDLGPIHSSIRGRAMEHVRR